MHVASDGRSCFITSYGDPAHQANPADSGRVVKAPTHGKAEFLAPEAKYTPEQGYVGNDEFEFEAFARGRGNQQLRLKVQVRVTVTAP